MSAARDRKEAAARLGVALQARYRRLLEARGDEETVAATADLAQCMYENVEFVVWCLKEFGGIQQMPIERRRAPSKSKIN